MTEPPATADDFAAVRRDIRDLIDAIRASSSGHVQTIQLQPAPPPPQRSERLVWLMSVIATGAIVAAVLQGQRLTDTRADFARDIDRLERRQDMHAEWARGESGILRGYIWTGKVPVANPYPKEAEP